MEKNSLILSLLLLICGSFVRAQEEPATLDSIIVMGTVVDHMTNEPQPFCLLQFIQGTDTTATVRCNEAGDFISNPMPIGNYSLIVNLAGHPVYQYDLVLYDNANLRIAIVSDSFSYRNLRPIEVSAMKHLLGNELITSTRDIRLWDFSGNMDGDVNASKTGDPNHDRIFSRLLCHPGLEPHPLGSSMKNELLIYGHILDTYHPAQKKDAEEGPQKEKIPQTEE